MKTNTTLIPAWLRRAILCTAACLLPFDLVSAQDFEAVERRLGAGVEDGELTLDQAKVMFDALKRAYGADRELEAKKRKFEEVTRMIKAAVAEGKLSKADAEKKFDTVRREMFGKGGAEEHRDREAKSKKARFAEAAREIEAALDAGKLSKREAEKKLNLMRQQLSDPGAAEGRRDREMEAKKRKFMQVAREIEAALEAGKLSKDEAERKLGAVRREMFGEGKSEDRD